MTGKTSNQENTRELALRVATEEETRRKTDPNESHEKSLIVIGSKEVGKTTMIHRFLEKEDAPKSTLAMDYTYGRKAGKSLVKDVVHVWEVGYLSASLIAGAMTGCTLSHSPHHTTILIMLDLGKPESLWNTIEECLTALRAAVHMKYTAELIEELKRQKMQNLEERSKQNDDAYQLSADFFPMRLCLVGGKYDEFREFEGVDREFIGQVLRATAHVLGASLHYHSAKDSQILRRTKELLSNYGFKGQPMKGSSTDYDKPLSVPVGSDSFFSIDLVFPRGKATMTLNAIKQIYTTRFPQADVEREANLEDPGNDPDFNEPIIDRLKLQREQEISILLSDMLEAPTTSIPIPEPY